MPVEGSILLQVGDLVEIVAKGLTGIVVAVHPRPNKNANKSYDVRPNHATRVVRGLIYSELKPLPRRLNKMRQDLVEGVVNLCRHMANKYALAVGVHHFDELLSAAFEGSVIAAGKYDPAKGIPFHGYALIWMRERMLREIDILSRWQKSLRDFTEPMFDPIDVRQDCDSRSATIAV